MGIFDRDDLLPGLLPASFRGVQFHMPDASTEAGRRVVVTLFPGIDAPAFDDLGQHAGPIWVTGILLGDDYVAQALALQAAFQAAGPGTLLHPWLGEMSVIVADPAQIRFSTRALRLVSFDASFLRADIGSFPIISTLSSLLASIASLASLPATLVSLAVGTATMAVSTWSSLVNTATAAGDLVSSAAGAAPNAAQLSAAIEAPLAGLSTATTGAPGEGSATALASAFSTTCEAVASLARGASVAAIGSAASASVDAVADPRSGATLLLDLAAAIDAIETVTIASSAMRLACETAAVAAAARAATDIDYESRDDALVWRETMAGAIERLIGRASEIASVAPAAAATALTALDDVAGALGRDMNEIIGRLPAVERIAPAGTVSAWLIAQHLVGDDPADVVDMLDDIVIRNRLRHPALVSPEGVEVLL